MAAALALCRFAPSCPPDVALALCGSAGLVLEDSSVERWPATRHRPGCIGAGPPHRCAHGRLGMSGAGRRQRRRCGSRALLAKRVGFEPVVRSPINDLGLIESPQIAKSTQNLSFRYKTGTAILRRLPPLALQRLVQVPIGLQPHPELRRRLQKSRQPQRRIGRDPALAEDDLVQPVGRDASRSAALTCPNPSGLRYSSSRISPGGIAGPSQSDSLVIILDTDFVGMAVLPPERHPVLVVHADTAALGPLALQSLKTSGAWRSDTSS